MKGPVGLPLGAVVEPWGKIGAKMITCGEPYYMLVGKEGVVALLPAKMVNAHHRMNTPDDGAKRG